MLHAKALPKVLEQAAGGGVSAAMLLNAQGELVAAAPAKGGAGQRHRHAGAIAATVWETYARLCGGDGAQQQQQPLPLAELLFDCEAGRVSAAAVGASGFLLCLVAKQSPQQPAAEFGMLRRKSQALVAALAQPLSEWASAAPRS